MYQLRIEARLEASPYMVPECSVCRGECGVYFLSVNREIIGCDSCHEPGDDFDSVVDAWEWRGV